ncbi:MAG: hypothetical protein IAG13_16485 [Deltaproteobacteria bacterium]|nr:hypothetical protein [Nannocystaceae bacterium]
MILVSWTPATLHRAQAIVELETRGLGVPMRAEVVLERLTPVNFERVAHTCAGIPAGDRPTGDDWRRLQPARAMISLVTTRRDVLVPLAKHWTVSRTLRDRVSPEIIGAVLRTLALPADECELWEPLLREAPPDTVAFWRSFKAQGMWQRYFGQVIEACTTISTSCPLAAVPIEDAR